MMTDFQIALSGEVVARIMAFRNAVIREEGVKVTWNAVINRLLLYYRENQALKSKLKSHEVKIETIKDERQKEISHFLELALSRPQVSSPMIQTQGILIPPPPYSKQILSIPNEIPKPSTIIQISDIKAKVNITKELNAHISTLKEGEPLLPSMVLHNPIKIEEKINTSLEADKKQEIIDLPK
jgi:hypothetical protein